MTVGIAESDIAIAKLEVTLVDAMATVQSMGKPKWIKNCSQLAEHFISCVFQQYNDDSEVHLIFDRYDLPLSLKSATRDGRQGGQQPVFYHITDTTNIPKVPIKRLLSHVNKDGVDQLFGRKDPCKGM